MSPSPFYWCENWYLERLSNLLKVMLWINGGASIRCRYVWLQNRFWTTCYTVTLSQPVVLVIPSHFNILSNKHFQNKQTVSCLCSPECFEQKYLMYLLDEMIRSYLKRSNSSFWSPISLRKWMRCLRATCRTSSSRKRTSDGQEEVRWRKIKAYYSSVKLVSLLTHYKINSSKPIRNFFYGTHP